ncbi:MAG: hypothetical protein LUD07_01865 [Clostridiales bacterium]|nr:hypothetical protein [Clostridiales bacterium]
MKYYIKLLVKSIGIVIACATLGLLLLVGSFDIPTERIEKNVISSVETFQKEGTYPHLNIIGDSQLDNWTDAIIILNAVWSNDSNILDRSIAVYRPSIKGKISEETLIIYYGDRESISEEDVGVTSYARYWHGYLVFVKPLLSFFTFAQIRIINGVFVFILALILLGVMYLKKMGRYIIPYIIALLLIDPFAISQSLQFTTIYYIYTIASIIYLLKKKWFNESMERLVVFFVLIGCITSYLDFLTYPLATFGVPVTLYLCSSKIPLKEAAKNSLIFLIAWGIGYIGMWGGKWILGSILGNQNIIKDALGKILEHSSMSDAKGKEFSVFKMLKLQFEHLKNPALGIAMIYILITVISFLRYYPKKKICNLIWMVYLSICFLPIIWFIGASHHSYIHHWFTYRELITTVFSGMCLFARYSARTVDID